jgi:c-di-GMP-binding flagellar brake protein YcgR
LPVFQENRSFCRRRSSRFAAPEYVYVYWRSDGMDDVSRVRDLSVGGLFVNTEKARREGVTLKIEFLVQEGQIRAEAVVRRSEASVGLGLKFTAITQEDRHRLAALLGRLRSYRTETRKKGREWRGDVRGHVH